MCVRVCIRVCVNIYISVSLCVCVCRCVYDDDNHHHHVTLSARISRTLSLATPYYRSLLPACPLGHIPYGYRVAVCRFELIVLPLLVHVKGSTGINHSSLLLLQCPACLVRLIFIVFVMGGRWPYSCCFAGCCLQDLFNIARCIFV